MKQDIGRRFVPLGFTQKGCFYYGISKGGDDVYIAEFDPETGEILVPPKKAIKHFEGSNAESDYSPDGKYLAYVSRRRAMPFITTGASHPIVLCIYSFETGEEREFSPRKLERIAEPRWSPDCSHIFVAGKDYEGRWGIYQIDTQTGAVTPLVPPSEDSRQFAHECSRDGKVLFLGRRSRTDDLSQIMLREIESVTEKELYHASYMNRLSLSCSPDCKWLAFITFIDDEGVLRIMPAAGGEPRELYRFEEEETLGTLTLTWTADGKYILFTRKNPKKDDPEWELCRIPAEGGEPQKLGLEMNSIRSLSVHPDGRHIAFSTSTTRPGEIWVMENFLPGSTAGR